MDPIRHSPAHTRLLLGCAALALVQAAMHGALTLEFASFRSSGGGCIGCFPGGLVGLAELWLLGLVLVGVAAIWGWSATGRRGGVPATAAWLLLAGSVLAVPHLAWGGLPSERTPALLFAVPAVLCGLAGLLLGVTALGLPGRLGRRGRSRHRHRDGPSPPGAG